MDHIELEQSWYNYVGSVNGTIMVKTNRKSYSKEVNDFHFNQISIKDVGGDDSATGEVTLEFYVKDSPFPITPYSQKINIEN